MVAWNSETAKMKGMRVKMYQSVFLSFIASTVESVNMNKSSVKGLFLIMSLQ